MNRHTTTDPRCRKHRAPSNAIGRWRFDRNRGRACRPCGMHHQYDPDTYTCACGALDHPEWWGVTA